MGRVFTLAATIALLLGSVWGLRCLYGSLAVVKWERVESPIPRRRPMAAMRLAPPPKNPVFSFQRETSHPRPESGARAPAFPKKKKIAESPKARRSKKHGRSAKVRKARRRLRRAFKRMKLSPFRGAAGADVRRRSASSGASMETPAPIPRRRPAAESTVGPSAPPRSPASVGRRRMRPVGHRSLVVPQSSVPSAVEAADDDVLNQEYYEE